MEQAEYNDNTVLLSCNKWESEPDRLHYDLVADDLKDDNGFMPQGVLVDLYLSLLDGYTIVHPLIFHHIFSNKKVFCPLHYIRYRNPDVYQIYKACRQNPKNYFFIKQKSKYVIDKLICLINHPQEKKLLQTYLENQTAWDQNLWETCLVNGYSSDLPFEVIPKAKPAITLDTDNAISNEINICTIRIDSALYPESRLIERITRVMRKYNRKLKVVN